MELEEEGDEYNGRTVLEKIRDRDYNSDVEDSELACWESDDETSDDETSDDEASDDDSDDE